jgi:hypothetical protein
VRRAALLALLALLLAAAAPQHSAAALTCAAGNDATTCAALDDVFTGAGGERWASSAGWRDAAAGAATDYCTFFGVACSSGSSLVTSLCVPLSARAACTMFACCACWRCGALTLCERPLRSARLLAPARWTAMG